MERRPLHSVKFDKLFLFYFIYCDTQPSIFWASWEFFKKVTPGFWKEKGSPLSRHFRKTGCLHKVLSIYTAARCKFFYLIGNVSLCMNQCWADIQIFQIFTSDIIPDIKTDIQSMSLGAISGMISEMLYIIHRDIRKLCQI